MATNIYSNKSSNDFIDFCLTQAIHLFPGGERLYYKILKELQKCCKIEQMEIPSSLFPDCGHYNRIDSPVKTLYVDIDFHKNSILKMSKKYKNLNVMVHHPSYDPTLQIFSGLVMSIQAINFNYLIRKNDKKFADNLFRRIHFIISRSKNDLKQKKYKIKLKVPINQIHTISDLWGHHYIKGIINKSLNQKTHTVQDFIRILKGIPEYRDTRFRLLSGSKSNQIQGIETLYVGGTTAQLSWLNKLYENKINTLILIAVDDWDKIKLQKKLNQLKQFNLILANHRTSDSIGINLMLHYYLENINKRLKIIAGKDYIPFFDPKYKKNIINESDNNKSFNFGIRKGIYSYENYFSFKEHIKLKESQKLIKINRKVIYDYYKKTYCYNCEHVKKK